MPKLFGGVALPDAYYSGLEHACSAFNLIREEDLRSWQGRAEALTEADSKRQIGGDTNRYWYQIDQEMWATCWISLNPGEYRETRPDPPALVETLEIGEPEIPMRQFVASAVASCTGLPPFSARDSEVLHRARSLLERKNEDLPVEMYNKLRSSHGFDQIDYQKVIDELYTKFFSQMGCPLSVFSSAVAFAQLQRILIGPIEQDWRSDPNRYARSYIDHCLNLPEHREPCIKSLSNLVLKSFESGRSRIKVALDGSMEDLPHQIMLAWDDFNLGNIVVRSMDRAAVAKVKIPVTSILLEEAIVCTGSALIHSAEFCFERPGYLATSLLRRAGADPKQASRMAKREANEMRPVLTRRFASIVASQTLVASDKLAWVRQGVEQLEQSRAQLPGIGYGFESEWIDHVLLQAHEKLGNGPAKKNVAFRVAARWTLRRAMRLEELHSRDVQPDNGNT